jgi:hypothetical protein
MFTASAMCNEIGGSPFLGGLFLTPIPSERQKSDCVAVCGIVHGCVLQIYGTTRHVEQSVRSSRLWHPTDFENPFIF